MADYRPVKIKIWSDNWFVKLAPEEKLVWIFLLTNEYLHISGIYELPENFIAPVSGVPNALAIFKKFETDGKIIYREGWLFICNYVKNQNKQFSKKNVEDNIMVSMANHLRDNSQIISLFNLDTIEPWQGLIRQFSIPFKTLDRPFVDPSERVKLKDLKGKVVNDGDFKNTPTLSTDLSTFRVDNPQMIPLVDLLPHQ